MSVMDTLRWLFSTEAPPPSEEYKKELNRLNSATNSAIRSAAETHNHVTQISFILDDLVEGRFRSHDENPDRKPDRKPE